MSFVDFRGNSLHVSVDEEVCFRNIKLIFTGFSLFYKSYAVLL